MSPRANVSDVVKRRKFLHRHGYSETKHPVNMEDWRDALQARGSSDCPESGDRQGPNSPSKPLEGTNLPDNSMADL